MLEHIAKQENWKTHYESGTLSEGIRQLENGQIDLLAAVPYSAEKDSVFRFSRETVISTWANVFSLKQTEIRSILDLHQLTVGVVRDDPYNHELRAIIKQFNIDCNFIEFKHYQEIIDAIRKKWIQAGVVDRLFELNRQSGNEIHKTQILFSPVELRFAASKGESEVLVDVLDYHIDEMKKDPQSIYYQELDAIMGNIERDSRILAVFRWVMLGSVSLLLLLMSMNYLLQRRVRRNTAQLSSKNKQLENEILHRKKEQKEKQHLEKQIIQLQKLEAIGQLAGGVAHDFNNILSGITGYGQMIKRKLGTDRPDLDRYVDIILDSCQRAADVISKLLAFARKGNYELKIVDIHDTVQHVSKLLKHSIDKRIQMVQHFKASSPTVMGDRTQLENAILNLAVNARDAMPEGGVLTFETDEVRLTEDQIRHTPFQIDPGKFIKIKVSDTGTGMTEEVQSKIFEPFFTTKEPGKGTGLGLSSVFGTVKSHNGCIEVKSGPGLGSIFEILLPVCEKLPKTETSSDTGMEKGSGHILLADDEETIRELTTNILEELGYSVTPCRNGKEALEFFKNNHKSVHLVLLDIMMPVMNGHDCFLEMKKIDPAVKAIVASGYSMEGEAGRMIAKGARAFMQKPYTLEDLSKTIRKVLVEEPPA